jgi:hypothetical protein
MAFAQPSAISETSLGTAGVTINVQLPATIASGALIEINLGYENANLGVPDPGTPTGYTLKKSITTNSGKDAATFLYMKVADGTEGGTTVAFTTSMNCVVAAQARVWTAWVGTLANVIVSTGINVVSAGPNPDSVTTGGAAADNVFVVGMGIYVNLGTVSAYSSGYTGGTLTQAGDTTDGAGMATCYLESAAASDDPGAFSLSESERCHGYTYVIPPEVGTDFPVSMSEAISLSDAFGATKNVPVSVSEAITLADSYSASAAALAAVSEAIVLSAAQSGAAAAAGSVSEAIALGDTMAAVRGILAEISEAIALADTMAAQAAALGAVSEALSLQDAASAAAAASASLSDAIALGDTMAASAAASAAIEAALSLADTMSGVEQTPQPPGEGASFLRRRRRLM